LALCSAYDTNFSLTVNKTDAVLPWLGFAWERLLDDRDWDPAARHLTTAYSELESRELPHIVHVSRWLEWKHITQPHFVWHPGGNSFICTK